MDHASLRDLRKREAVADITDCVSAGNHFHSLLQSVRGDDVAFLTISINEKSNTGRAVRIVLDRVNDRRNSVLVATEVDQTIGTLVAAAAMTAGDDALIVAATGTTLRFKKRLLYLCARSQISKIADAGIAAARRGGFVMTNSHFTNSILSCMDNFVIVLLI